MDICSAASTFLTDSLELELGTEWCKPPCFSCAFDNRGGGGKHFSGESYLSSGTLKRLLLNLDPLPTNFEEDTVEIFGIQWVTETALVNSSRVLFHLFRQQLYNLETLLQANCDFGKISTLHCKADNIRQQCITFLHYVKVFIFRHLKAQNAENVPVHPYEVLEAQLPSALVDELHGILLYVGHLSELRSINPGAYENQNQIKLFPPSWHLLHLHLDIHWLVLEILQMLGEKLKQVVYGHQFMNLAGDSLTNVSLFEEHCENLLCDLIHLSLNRYDKVRPSEALMSHHCPCPCFKELWVLLIHLLDHRSKWSLSEAFWNWLNKLLKPLFETSSDQRRPSVPIIQPRDPLGFSWWIIAHVASFYQFDRHGAPNETRHMESNWSFVEELLKKSINVQFCTVLIYSKFHQKRMEELTEVGLQNFFNLFLLLAAVADVEDVASHVLDLLNFLKPAFKTSPLIWKGQAAFLLMYTEKNLDIGALAEKFSGDFQEKAKEFLVSKNDEMGQRHTLWTLLSIYIDGVQEVFETSHCLHASHEKLLNDGFSMLLRACQESELRTVLNFLQAVLARIRNMHQQLGRELQKGNVDLNVQSSLLAKERHLAAVAGALWRHFFSFLKSQRMSQTVSLPQLADAAAEKEYMEQLAELTRLLFKLSEVKNIFAKAQVECLPIPEDPKKALVRFLEAVGVTYGSLQQLSDKSAMVTKSLEYLGEILKYIKPYLGKKISSAGLHLTYSVMGILVKSWAQIFATSKAQKLLFRIIDCLLLPHLVLQQEKELPAPMLTAIQKSLPWFLQGMCIVCCQSQNPNAYLNQLLGNVTEQYIGRFLPASPHLLDLGQHPVLLALRNSATGPSMSPLKKCIVQVIRALIKMRLQMVHSDTVTMLSFSLLVKRLATENLQYMVRTCQAGSGDEPAARLTSVFRQFIQDYGMRYDYQIYSILETVATLDQQLVIHLITTLTQSLKDSERKWGLGRNIKQRKAYSQLLSHLGQVGQDEIQRLENDDI
ncbi:PREDICTED: protein MMS22-like [Hipposideros armiger]|uniref:Protein MMS22-like n=1 Tax=Hipposideros armiger TaxID=186990 RepID=A0A8B7QJZ8_HIPAR|nr:PREDICTED: protein MMS22-like [Hipposideros armiger]